MVGIGRAMMTISTKNINTPWYIVIPNDASFEKQFFLTTVASYAARTGLHWNIKGNSPETVKMIKNPIIPYPMRWILGLGNTLMMKATRLVLTAVATKRYVQRETYMIYMPVSD